MKVNLFGLTRAHKKARLRALPANAKKIIGHKPDLESCGILILCLTGDIIVASIVLPCRLIAWLWKRFNRP
jgi:hypothetical protein